MKNASKSSEEHFKYLLDIVHLKLWYLWNWLRKHPEVEFTDAIRERVDIIRKTDVNKLGVHPKDNHFDDPQWLEMEANANEVYRQHKDDMDASAFEREAIGIFIHSIEKRAPMDFRLDEAADHLTAYQCGSLKYDAPSEDLPTRANFHIANAIQPLSIFAEREYLPNLFFQLMDESESNFGCDTLRTGTWLNSHPIWLQLFPNEWMDNRSDPYEDIKWHYGFWGQFINARGAFNHKYGKRMRDTGEFPYAFRTSHCSFQAMRQHLKTYLSNG